MTSLPPSLYAVVSPAEAATALAVSRQRIDQLCRDNTLLHRHAAGTRIIDRASVDAYAACRTGPGRKKS